jgi:hypothetical protein
MRSILTLLLLAFCGPLLGQEDLVKKKEKKLASKWLTKAPWITDYDQAREQAKNSGKPIFAYFTRSYAP